MMNAIVTCYLVFRTFTSKKFFLHNNESSVCNSQIFAVLPMVMLYWPH
jgi:hypothetical protein